jgi:hypothetical protein
MRFYRAFRDVLDELYIRHGAALFRNLHPITLCLLFGTSAFAKKKPPAQPVNINTANSEQFENCPELAHPRQRKSCKCVNRSAHSRVWTICWRFVVSGRSASKKCASTSPSADARQDRLVLQQKAVFLQILSCCAASTLLRLLLICRWRGAPHRPVTQNPNVSVIRAFENENLPDVGFLKRTDVICMYFKRFDIGFYVRTLYFSEFPIAGCHIL